MIFNSSAVNFVTLSDERSCDTDRKVSPACNQPNFLGAAVGSIEISCESSHGVVLKAEIRARQHVIRCLRNRSVGQVVWIVF